MNWNADIMNEAKDDLVTVDLRTLSPKKLRMLRFDALMAHDADMVRSIDRLLYFRQLSKRFDDTVYRAFNDEGEVITGSSVSEARQEITDRWDEILNRAEPFNADAVEETWDELDIMANGLVMTPGPWWIKEDHSTALGLDK